MKNTLAKIVVSVPVFLGIAANGGAVRITEYFPPTSNSEPGGIVLGPDMDVWFTERAAGKIGRVRTAIQGPATPIPAFPITEYSLPVNSYPSAITTGPDGALWFANGDTVGRITTAGVVSTFELGGAGYSVAIVAGPDGNLWVATTLVSIAGPAGKIVRMTTSGAVTSFDVPYPGRIATALAAGPDGNIWFAGVGTDIPLSGTAVIGTGTFGVVGNLTTAGDSRGARRLAAGIPQDIAAGPDGHMWFTVQIVTSFAADSPPSSLGKIGRFEIVPNGLPAVPKEEEFTIPAPNSAPSAIAVGPDGALWFTDLSTPPRIGRITTTGAITEISAPSLAGGIAAGPFSTVWFTEPTAGRVAEVALLFTICTPSPTALCLDDGRLQVEATWRTSDGATGSANAVPLGSTYSSGYFWFFSPETPEVMIKAVGGCWTWFFAGGLTDVQVDLHVTDVLSGTVKTYSNPLGTPFVPVQDTTTFSCPPQPLVEGKHTAVSQRRLRKEELR